MASRAPDQSRRPASVVGSPGRGSLPGALALRQGEAPKAHSSALPADGMSCVAAYWLIFDDPQWGPVSLELSVWRDDRADLPDYTVIVD